LFIIFYFVINLIDLHESLLSAAMHLHIDTFPIYTWKNINLLETSFPESTKKILLCFISSVNYIKVQSF